jgi:hypothetical protein
MWWQYLIVVAAIAALLGIKALAVKKQYGK